MQTLDVGSGMSNAEYHAIEEQRRADLRLEARECAHYFFWATLMAGLGTGILPIKVSVIVSIGVIDLLSIYGRSLGELHALAIMAVSIAWIFALIGLGFAARSGHRWAFIGGIALYAIDAIALVVTFSLWAFGVHCFLIYKWFEGQKAVAELKR